MQEEEEFSISLFLTGDTIYDFKDQGNPNSCWACINCHKVFAKSYKDIGCCPNCYLNTLISISGRGTFERFKLLCLREMIIVEVLDMFEYDMEY